MFSDSLTYPSGIFSIFFLFIPSLCNTAAFQAEAGRQRCTHLAVGHERLIPTDMHQTVPELSMLYVTCDSLREH